MSAFTMGKNCCLPSSDDRPQLLNRLKTDFSTVLRFFSEEMDIFGFEHKYSSPIFKLIPQLSNKNNAGRGWGLSKVLFSLR